MKKLYASFLFTIIFLSRISAQTYYPLLDSVNDWKYSYNQIGLRLAQPSTQLYPCGNYPAMVDEFTTGNDSVIHSTPYRTLLYLGGGNCVAGFLREDTAARKVFYRYSPSDSELLVYDFSMQIGDTMTVQFANGNGYWNSGIFTLDSIVPYHIISGWRRMFYLNNHVNGGHTLSWLESVGNQGDLVYKFGQNQYGNILFTSLPYFPHDYGQILTCFHHDYMVYYDSLAQHYASTIPVCMGYTDSCTYGNVCDAIKENQLFASMQVSPNPSSGRTQLHLQLQNNSECEVVIWNIEGKQSLLTLDLGKLEQGDNTVSIDLSSLSNGLYTIELRTSSGSVYDEIMIAK